MEVLLLKLPYLFYLEKTQPKLSALMPSTKIPGTRRELKLQWEACTPRWEHSGAGAKPCANSWASERLGKHLIQLLGWLKYLCLKLKPRKLELLQGSTRPRCLKVTRKQWLKNFCSITSFVEPWRATNQNHCAYHIHSFLATVWRNYPRRSRIA